MMVKRIFKTILAVWAGVLLGGFMGNMAAHYAVGGMTGPNVPGAIALFLMFLLGMPVAAGVVQWRRG